MRRKTCKLVSDNVAGGHRPQSLREVKKDLYRLYPEGVVNGHLLTSKVL